MRSHLTEGFENRFRALPAHIQRLARKNYELWIADPGHPSLQFKQVSTRRPIYAVRVGIGWRALGTKEGDVIVWFWIGSHAEYDRLLTDL